MNIINMVLKFLLFNAGWPGFGLYWILYWAYFLAVAPLLPLVPGLRICRALPWWTRPLVTVYTAGQGIWDFGKTHHRLITGQWSPAQYRSALREAALANQRKSALESSDG